jgi:pyridoxamine 5'-phosphate oxidase
MTSEQHDFTQENAPFDLFKAWLEDATKTELNDPNAMTLATVDADGLPDARMVLLKGLDSNGFVFYSNAESQKGNELAGNKKAALVFHWKSLRRSIRVRGLVESVSSNEADAYFKSRPHLSQIGAWASQQSRPLESRFALEKAVAFYTAKYLIGNVPRPAYWQGWRVLPLSIEFWHDRPFRLHDRVVFKRKEVTGEWTKERLYP